MQNGKRIYLCLAQMSENGMEQKYVQEAFDTHWVAPLGPNVNAFESELKSFVTGKSKDAQASLPEELAKKEVVALSSGTAALHLALLNSGVQAGDEVLVQSFTFCASANAVTYVGAKPVFVDSEEDTWNMCPALMEKAILDRIDKTGRAPKAVIPVALYGMPYNIDDIMSITAKYNITVIEDAAEGFGSCYKGRTLGTFAPFGVLSFNGNKMITTSGGGALVCKDLASKQEVMFYATQARESFSYYEHEHIGFNYRMSNVCAGIGRGQMTVAEHHILHHRHLTALYRSLLEDVSGIKLHLAPNDSLSLANENQHPSSSEYWSNYWLNTILIDPELKVKGQENAYTEAVGEALGGVAGVTHRSKMLHTAVEPNANVEAMRVLLDKAGIEARPLWKPMHLQPVYANNAAYVNGVGEKLFRCGLCLPSGPCVSDEEVRFIVEEIKKAIVL